jgi:CheY-like chemotaxis protein
MATGRKKPLPANATTISLARILLVEDDPSDVVLTLAALGDLGLAEQVVVVNDGLQALDYLHARQAYCHRSPGQPAVIVLDVKLPMIDGFEVLAQVRAHPATRLLPVVLFSTSNQPRDRERAYELGANGYVVKTIDCAANNAALYAIAQFWVVANEPPPGCLPRPKLAMVE